jgi:hypothetical protein
MIVQVPFAIIDAVNPDAVDPETLQTPVVEELKVTGPLEEAVAIKLTVAPTV